MAERRREGARGENYAFKQLFFWKQKVKHMNPHQNHIAERRYRSMYHFGLAIPNPKAMKIPAAKATADKKRDKLKSLPAWIENLEFAPKAQKTNSNTFRNIDGIMPLEHSELAEHLQTCGRDVFRGDNVNGDENCQTVFF